jgi:hypothetical protein
MGILPNFFSTVWAKVAIFLDVLNTSKYRQIFAGCAGIGIGIGIWSPEYRYSGIGIYGIPDWKHYRPRFGKTSPLLY